MELTATELAAQLSGRVVVDIRRVGEWRLTGVIPGAHRLTFFDTEGNADPATWLSALAKIAAPEDDLVLICRSGQRTGVVLEFLHSQTPYTRARHLAGGMRSWLEAGFPAEGVSD